MQRGWEARFNAPFRGDTHDLFAILAEVLLGSHCKYRSLIVPSSAADAPVLADGAAESHIGQAGAGVDGVELAGAAYAPAAHARYRPWAQLLRATFAIDVEVCPACQGRMRLAALVTVVRRRRREFVEGTARRA